MPDFIVKIFKFLSLTYGAGLKRSMGDVSQQEVMEFWAEQLAFFADKPYAIEWALDHLPEHCPNLIVFRNLCKEAPEPYIPPPLALPAPEMTEEQLAKNRERIAQLIKDIKEKPVTKMNSKQWAESVLERVKNGERISYCTKNYARDVLRQYNVKELL